MSDNETRKRILLAAGPIFARKGFRSSTVREICDAAKVNVASINYYFGDKQRLYNETVVLAREIRAQKVPNPSWDEDTRPETKLKDFVIMMLERLGAFEAEPWQVRLIMREILKPTEASRKLVTDYFRPFLETMMSIVDDLVGKRLSDEKRHQIAFSIIGQCLYYRFTSDLTNMMVAEKSFGDAFSRKALAQHIFEFSHAAIRGVTEPESKQVSVNAGISQQQCCPKDGVQLETDVPVETNKSATE